MRIVIADDQRHARQGLRAILSAEFSEAEITEAVDGSDAVRVAEELVPDLIIMDVGMPVLDGVEATRLIKARHPRVRILGHSLDSRSAPAMRAAGADAFVVKGQPTAALLAAARSLLPGPTCAPPAPPVESG